MDQGEKEVFSAFVKEKLKIVPGVYDGQTLPNDKVSAPRDIFIRFRQWARDNEIHTKITERKFILELADIPEVVTVRAKKYRFRGLNVVVEDDPDGGYKNSIEDEIMKIHTPFNMEIGGGVKEKCCSECIQSYPCDTVKAVRG